MINWYIVYTRPGSENTVANSLTEKKVENYCPVNEIVNQKNGRSTTIKVPLFASYVFIKTYEKELYEIKKIKGIINLVYWAENPAIIKNIEIDMIKRFLKLHRDVLLEKTKINITKIVRIVYEPLTENEKKFGLIGYNRAKLVLPSLGYLMVAVAEKENVVDVSQREYNDTKMSSPYA